MDLSKVSVATLPKIGPSYARRLQKLKIETVSDLLYHKPSRYLDFSQISKISTLRIGDFATVKVTLNGFTPIRTKGGKFLILANVADDSGSMGICWFNQPYIASNLSPGSTYFFSGKVQMYNKKIVFFAPFFEIEKEDNLHTARIVPIYPETAGISSKWLRTRIYNALESNASDIEDSIPDEILKRLDLVSLSNALTSLHFPKNLADCEIALSRLSFDELFLITLTSQIQKLEWRRQNKSFSVPVDQKDINTFISQLPFDLTNAQKIATQEILSDLSGDVSANRLLEGDVGSGKTIVAAIAAYVCAKAGLTTILMAPTDILANQHLQTFKKIFTGSYLKIGLWTAKTKDWQNDIVIGTHALIAKEGSQKIKKSQIGLIVIDEQHRFGVAQRSKLASHEFGASGKSPHILTMTATPIPRTVALTLWGDVDISVLNEMPPGRKKVVTRVVGAKDRNKAYKFIKDKLDKGDQAFVICPFIEQSETMSSVKSASDEFQRLKGIFKPHTVGLVHGKLKTPEKLEIIDRFNRGEIDLLVATPIVEVGLDIPNATIMMIEGAERFGLAQLHQLRGRVGRGDKSSYCLLFTSDESGNSTDRLKLMETTTDGAKLSAADLKLRGPGEIFGLSQHGFFRLKFADFFDFEQIKLVKSEVEKLLKVDPTLKKHPKLLLTIKKIKSEVLAPN